MSAINFGHSVSLREFAQGVATVGKVRRLEPLARMLNTDEHRFVIRSKRNARDFARHWPHHETPNFT